MLMLGIRRNELVKEVLFLFSIFALVCMFGFKVVWDWFMVIVNKVFVLMKVGNLHVIFTFI